MFRKRGPRSSRPADPIAYDNVEPVIHVPSSQEPLQYVSTGAPAPKNPKRPTGQAFMADKYKITELIYTGNRNEVSAKLKFEGNILCSEFRG